MGVFHGCFNDLRGDLPHLAVFTLVLAESLDGTGDPDDGGDRIVVRAAALPEDSSGVLDLDLVSSHSCRAAYILRTVHLSEPALAIPDVPNRPRKQTMKAKQ